MSPVDLTLQPHSLVERPVFSSSFSGCHSLFFSHGVPVNPLLFSLVCWETDVQYSLRRSNFLVPIQTYQVVIVGACFLVNYVTAGSKTNWAEGMAMVTFYIMIVSKEKKKFFTMVCRSDTLTSWSIEASALIHGGIPPRFAYHDICLMNLVCSYNFGIKYVPSLLDCLAILL